MQGRSTTVGELLAGSGDISSRAGSVALWSKQFPSHVVGNMRVTGVHLLKSIYSKENGEQGFQTEDQLIYVTAQFFTLLFLTVPLQSYHSQAYVRTLSPFHVWCYYFDYSLLVRNWRQ